jgi:hypothetical protein
MAAPMAMTPIPRKIEVRVSNGVFIEDFNIVEVFYKELESSETMD